MKVSTKCLGFTKLGCEIAKKNKSLVEEKEALQKTFTDENASDEGVWKELDLLRSSVSAFHALAAKFTELKSLQSPSVWL